MDWPTNLAFQYSINLNTDSPLLTTRVPPPTDTLLESSPNIPLTGVFLANVRKYSTSTVGFGTYWISSGNVRSFMSISARVYQGHNGSETNDEKTEERRVKQYPRYRIIRVLVPCFS